MTGGPLGVGPGAKKVGRDLNDNPASRAGRPGPRGHYLFAPERFLHEISRDNWR